MNKKLKVLTLIAALGFSGAANAALVSRLGGLAYYDTVLDITWLQDANYAQTSGYDADGRMTWADANAWAASLTVASVGGWRLPDTGPVNGVAFSNYGSYDGSTDQGYNVSAPGTIYAGSTGSEMAYMSYNTLGNLAYYDTSGNGPQSGWGLTNTGPFSNIQSNFYWSATEYALDTNFAWGFAFPDGYQTNLGKTSLLYAWAVHSGDVSAVPIPAAAWLFGSGLLGLIGVARRKRAHVGWVERQRNPTNNIVGFHDVQPNLRNCWG